MGASSRVTTRRASLAVSSTSNARPRPALLRGEVLQEAHVERRVVGDQHAPGGELQERRQRRLDRTARPTPCALVMPVSTAMNAGISVRGSTRVWNSPSTSPPRTFTAPISVIIEPPCAEPPVVSRSTTQNVTSLSGTTQLVETALRLPAGARTVGGAAHGLER